MCTLVGGGVCVCVYVWGESGVSVPVAAPVLLCPTAWLGGRVVGECVQGVSPSSHPGQAAACCCLAGSGEGEELKWKDSGVCVPVGALGRPCHTSAASCSCEEAGGGGRRKRGLPCANLTPDLNPHVLWGVGLTARGCCQLPAVGEVGLGIGATLPD